MVFAAGHVLTYSVVVWSSRQADSMCVIGRFASVLVGYQQIGRALK